jgi:hypothetical protein
MKCSRLAGVIAGCFILAVFWFAFLRDRSTANGPSDSAKTTPLFPEQTKKGDSETPPIPPSNPSADKSEGRSKNPRVQDVEGFYQEALKSKGVDEVKYLKILDALDGLLSDPDYRDLSELDDIRKRVTKEIASARARLGDEQYRVIIDPPADTLPLDIQKSLETLEVYVKQGIKYFHEGRFENALQSFHTFEVLVERLSDNEDFMRTVKPLIEAEKPWAHQARQIVAERQQQRDEEKRRVSGDRPASESPNVVIEYIKDPVKRRLDAIRRLEGPHQNEWWSAAETLGEFIVAGYTDAIQTALGKISSSEEDIRFSLLYHLLLSYDEAVFKEALHQSFSNLSTSKKFKCLDGLYRLNHPDVLLREFSPASDLKQSEVESTIKRKRATAAAFLKERLDAEKEESLKNKIRTIFSSLED